LESNNKTKINMDITEEEKAKIREKVEKLKNSKFK